MQQNEGMQVGRMRIVRREAQTGKIRWRQAEKKRPGEGLMRNLAVASALMICAVTLRSGALPELSPATDAVLAAVTQDSLLDDPLGRLTFVGSFFPEAAAVFGLQRDVLAAPVSGGVVVHAWSEAEPWMAWQSAGRTVNAAAQGEVIGVYHGAGEERLVQVMGENGLSCLYGNLAQVEVTTGDSVRAGEPIGTLMSGADAVMEVRRHGVSVDPALLLGGA